MQTIATRILGFLLFFCGFAVAEEWQLQEEQQNVKVFTQITDTGYNRVKIETLVKAAPIALMRLLDDTEVAPVWIAHCRKVETLKWFGDDERTVHTYFSAPWPISDRDMVTYSKTEYLATGEIKIVVSDKGAEHVQQSHYVRMQGVTGQWQAIPQDNGNTRIVYQGYGEAAGSIPRWLANQLLVSSSLETFINLQEQIVLPKYQE